MTTRVWRLKFWRRSAHHLKLFTKVHTILILWTTFKRLQKFQNDFM